MRLLAVSAGDDAQGRITEAEEIVGRVTFDGTLGLILFTGVFGGALCGALFLLVRRFLPAGRLGGVAYGLALLIVLGTVTDPLRKENPDFDLVGPGWVAVLVFTVLAIGFGVAVGGFTARASTWFPRFSAGRGSSCATPFQPFRSCSPLLPPQLVSCSCWSQDGVRP